MQGMDTINVSLTPLQIKKFGKGMPIQMTHHSLMKGGAIDMTAVLPAIHIHRLMTNLSHGKGFRLDPKHVKGGSILNHVKHFATELLKKQSTKDLITMGLQSAALAGSAAFGQPELGLLAAPAISSIVNHDYRVKPEVTARQLTSQAEIAAQRELDAQMERTKAQLAQQLPPPPPVYATPIYAPPPAAATSRIYGGAIGEAKKLRLAQLRAATPGLSHRDALKMIRDEESAHKAASRTDKGKATAAGKAKRKEAFDAFVDEYLEEYPEASRKEAERLIKDNKWFHYAKPKRVRAKKPETRLTVPGEKRKRRSQKTKDTEAAKAELDFSHWEEPSHEEVRKKYRKMALKWHPDKYSESSPHPKDYHVEKFRKISKAYLHLTGEGVGHILKKMRLSGGDLGHTILNGLKTAAHYAIPATIGAIGGAGGTALGGPIGGIAGSALGSYAGTQIDKKLGLGLRKRGGSLKSVGNDILSGLKSVRTHILPAAGAVVGGIGGMELGGPVGAVAGGAGGYYAGQELNHTFGMGLHGHRLGERIQVVGGNVVGGVPNPLMSRGTYEKIKNTMNTKRLLQGGSFASPNP